MIRVFTLGVALLAVWALGVLLLWALALHAATTVAEINPTVVTLGPPAGVGR